MSEARDSASSGVQQYNEAELFKENTNSAMLQQLHSKIDSKINEFLRDNAK